LGLGVHIVNLGSTIVNLASVIVDLFSSNGRWLDSGMYRPYRRRAAIWLN
jgi:hypothetical protein